MITVEYTDNAGDEVRRVVACGTFITSATNSKSSKIDIVPNKMGVSSNSVRKWVDFIRNTPFVSRMGFDGYKMVVSHKNNSYETFIMGLTVFRFAQEQLPIVERAYQAHALGFSKAQSLLIGVYYQYDAINREFVRRNISTSHMVFPPFNPMPKMLRKVKEDQKNMYGAGPIYKGQAGGYWNKKSIVGSLQAHKKCHPNVISFSWGNKMNTRKLFNNLF